MFFKIVFVLLFIIIGFNFASGQNGSLEFWRLQSYSGFIELESQYRAQQSILLNKAKENRTSSVFLGMLAIRTKSFFGHPNLMKLQADFDYNPGLGKDKFLVLPDRTETYTAEMARVQTTFFNQRPFSFNLFAHLNHNYINREYTTNVEVLRKGFGGNMYYKNKILPVSFRYQNENWEQDEIQSERIFTNDRESISAEANKSFSDLDHHKLNYSFEDYTRTYSESARIRNKITNVNLKNDISFNHNRNSNFNSYIWFTQQTGNDAYSRLQVNEKIDTHLPYNFRVGGKYQFSQYDQSDFLINQHNINSRLEHRLFSSLISYADYEYTDINQTSYNEYLNTYNLGFDYTKKIPTGHFSISYNHRNRHENRNGKSLDLQVNNEEHVINDSQVILLRNPGVRINTVVVTDESGLIIYEENFDYILIQRGEFIEIQRLFGGQIQDGSIVLVDYLAIQQLSYEFDALSNNVHTGITLFSNFIHLYFRYFEQDNKNFTGTDARILKNISQRVFGSRFSYKSLVMGFELDNFNSNIVPYLSKRYYLTYSGRLNQRVNFALSATLRDYKLTQENIVQKYTDISGNINYRLNNLSQFKAKAAYRFQDGRNIDLTLTTIKGEYLTNYRKVLFTLGVEFYKRDYLGKDITFSGGYIKIKRNF